MRRQEMKKAVTYLSALFFPLGAMMFNACGLVELNKSENGNLDGYWHLVTVDTLSTGGTTDLRRERCFWTVQGTLFQLYSPDWQDGQRYVSLFAYENNRLVLSDIRESDRMNGDPLVEDVDRIRPYGINSLQETFVVEELKGSRMVLCGDLLRLRFRKM